MTAKHSRATCLGYWLNTGAYTAGIFPEKALALADDVIILDGARVSYAGSAEEIRLRPAFRAAQLGVA